MILFFCDLDNTLIYSYKHHIGQNTLPVELYENRQISFMTEKSHILLKEVIEKTTFIPTTTRSLAQYQRIDLKIPTPHYALVANGGILLVDGEIDKPWYEDSLKRVDKDMMNHALSLLQQDKFVVEEGFESRFVDDLFLFTKSSNPQATIEALTPQLNTKEVSLHRNGAKVYVLPHNLTKGDALCRLKQRFPQVKQTFSAGDSDFDLPMLYASDCAFAPFSLKEKIDSTLVSTLATFYISEESALFSEFLLEEILEKVEKSI